MGGFSLRTLIFVTLMAAVGFYVLKATSGFIPFAPYKTFVSTI